METAVTNIDPDKKEITYEAADGKTGTESYDKLILSPGNQMVAPGFLNMDLENVMHFAGPAVGSYLRENFKNFENAVVIGAGFIGIEATSSFIQHGVNTTLVDMAETIIPANLDKEFTDVIVEDLKERGVAIQTGEAVKEIVEKDGKAVAVKTDKGEYPADVVIVAMGVRPNTGWLEGILELDERKYVVVDEHQRTSVADVYAAGDGTQVNLYTGGKAPIALVPPSRRTAAVAAKNALGDDSYKEGRFAGTSGLELFDFFFASTGIKDANADSYDGNVKSHYVEERIYPDFMHKDNNKIMMKVHYDADTEKILGAQLMAKGHDITASINTMVVAIAAGWTLKDLAYADFFFQPNLNRPWNYLNVLAMSARGELHGADKLLF